MQIREAQAAGRGRGVIVAVGQINTIIGDFRKNADKVIDYAKRAAGDGAELIVFPELCLCGYPPLDLLDYDAFVEENQKQLRRIQRCLPPELGVVLGYLGRNRSERGKGLINAASLLSGHKILHTQAKTLLPTYDVFDEARYFEPASTRKVVDFRGLRIGIAICEDIWWEGSRETETRYLVDPVKELLDLGAGLILVPSASPFASEKPRLRLSLLERIGKTSGVPVIYVNMVGGNDSLIFDGRSMVTSPEGILAGLGKPFAEDLFLVDTDKVEEDVALPEDRYGDIEQALVLGLRDYLEKCGYSKVHLGLSGGIDSALTAVLAEEALGPENVTAFALPSRYSSEGSLKDAECLAKNLNIPLVELPIEDVFSSFLSLLAPVFGSRPPDTAEENLQARIRGTLLMAYANKFSSLLLATGNKSELATGYCTLYGDMNGSLAILGDLFKTEVYELARYINKRKRIIPEEILVKAPSAELRPDQRDEDSLPPYDLLDRILTHYLIDCRSAEEIVAAGMERSVVYRVLELVGRAEYKRRQAPPVLKVSTRAFGTGRRMPIARSIYNGV